MYLAAQGLCVLSMDTRGQNNQSQDAAITPEGHYMGWMTQGIRDPQTYYYRYVYADAIRAKHAWFRGTWLATFSDAATAAKAAREGPPAT